MAKYNINRSTLIDCSKKCKFTSKVRHKTTSQIWRLKVHETQILLYDQSKFLLIALDYLLNVIHLNRRSEMCSNSVAAIYKIIIIIQCDCFILCSYNL